MDPRTPKILPATEANIQTILRLEQEFHDDRSRWDRMGDFIADFAGSVPFVLAQLLLFAIWIAINSGRFGMTPFDPYPFMLLALTVSLESVLLAAFVLIKQNSMSRRAEHRDHLNLQIDLLAEKEITKMLQMQRMLCERFGLNEAAEDQEVEQLSQDTAVEALARDLKEKLPDK
jgi:uncharacterized membrane protein